MAAKDYWPFLLASAASIWIASCSLDARAEAPIIRLPMEQVASTQSSAAADPATKADFSNPPETTPSPWVPFAVEVAMGAECPASRRRQYEGRGDSLLKGACRGRMPAHVAEFLDEIAARDMYLSSAERRDLTDEDDVHYRAMPGRGKRPDFLVEGNIVWVRTIESQGPDAATYLVQAPFECGDRERPELGRPEGAHCRRMKWDIKAYRVERDAAPKDVTTDVMPSKVSPTAAEHGRYAPLFAGEGMTEDDEVVIGLDTSKLQYVPTLRWSLEFDSENFLPSSDPRAYGDPAMAHFGFLVWTGRKYELRQRVSRSLWPCTPVPQGEAPCTWDSGDGPDPFVFDDK